MRKRSKIVIGSIAALALAGSSVFAGAAVAQQPPTDAQRDWGTIVPGHDGPQANAWVASVKGATNLVDTTLFETHCPGTPTAPKTEMGGKSAIDLTDSSGPLGIGLGVASGAYSRVVCDALPSSHGGAHVKIPGAAFASASGAGVDVGFPYIPNPRPRSIPLSPWGIHADGISIQAVGKPGKPVEFNGRFGKAYIYSTGKKIADVPADWPTNFGVRIPQDRTKPALANAITNEQVTTDSNGNPTVDDNGDYFLDPTASSGYVNAIRATALGLNAADVVVGHAAVLIQD